VIPLCLYNKNPRNKIQNVLIVYSNDLLYFLKLFLEFRNSKLSQSSSVTLEGRGS